MNHLLPHPSLLFFGGAYSNLQALLSLRAVAEERWIPPSSVICTGDAVAYCAQPVETIDAIRDWGIQLIAGNVELQLAAEQDHCGCNFVKGSVCDQLSAHWYSYANSRITAEQRAWIESLPTTLRLELGGRKIGVIHGSHANVSEFIFRSTPWERKAPNFASLDCDAIVGGHSGLPFMERNGDQLWANAGVIGMPANDGAPRGWYLLATERANNLEFSLHTFDYDAVRAVRLMEKKGLPCEYSSALRTGLWCNMDILPLKEQSQRGLPLTFAPVTLPKMLKLGGVA
jgi:predicted phosphodiesterase